MATIPLGEFDQVRVQQRPDTTRANTSATNIAGRGGEALGAAIANAGDAGLRVSRQQQAQEQQQANALARAKAANAMADYQLQVQAGIDDVGDQLRRGGDYTKAGDLYAERADKIQVPQIDGLPPEVLETYNGGIQRARESGRLKVNGLVVSARRDDGQRQFATLLDTLGKAAAAPGADVAAINAQARAALPLYREFGLDGSSIDKSVQDFEDRNWTNQAAGRFNQGVDNPGALQGLLHDLTADDGGYAGKLDPDKRNAMASRVASRIDTLQNKAERAADKNDAQVDRTLQQIDEQAASGVPATIEQRAAWAEVVKAAPPARRQEFVERFEEEQQIQALLRQPIDQQLQALQERQAALYTQGGDKHDIANLGRVRAAVQANVKMLREQPLAFAQSREGTEVEPLDLSALTDPAAAGKIGAQLQQRAALVGELRKQYGPQVRNRLLLPQEASQLLGGLDAMPPKRRVAAFGQLRAVIGSDATYLAVMQQVAPDAPVVALAGMLNLRNPKAAALVIQGEALLNRSKGDGADDGKFKAVKLPPQAEFDLTLGDAVGTAFRDRPEAYAVAMQAVRAGYAGAAATDGDVSGELDEKRLRNVVTAVLGQTVDYNGRGQVFVPYGMDPDRFDDQVEATWARLLPKLPAGVPHDLDHYGLQQAGDGRYYVTAGRMFLKDAAGNPLVLEVSP